MHNQTTSSRQRMRYVLVTLFLLAGLVAAGGSGVLAATPTLTGSVTIAGDGPAAGAVVVALHGDQPPVLAPVDASGAYTLNAGDGDWQVTVMPQRPPTSISPTWVYTAGAQLVNFSGGSSTRRLDFTVAPASATINGTLAAPGGVPFSGDNRAWVRAGNQEGQGNTVQVNPDGTFSVHVPPGNTMLHLTFANDQWAPPATLAGSEWFVDAGQTADVGVLQVQQQQAAITGSVLDEQGQPVPNIPVRAWRLDGSEVEETVSDASGAYTLRVISGTWELRATPPLDAPYVTAQSPQRVVLPNDTASRTQVLRVATADVTINGTIVDRNSVPIQGLRGHVFAFYDNGQRQLGPGVRIAPDVSNNSVFTLKLSTHVATDYAIRAIFPQGINYSGLAAVRTHVTPGETISITLPAAPNNSSISGHFNNHDTGEPQTGLPGIVYAASTSGGLALDRLNPLDGSYRMHVAATDTAGSGGSFWWLRGYVDPTTGYAVQHPRRQRVFIPYNNGNGADVTADFTVAQLDAAIAGCVTDAQGTAVAGALVSVREQGAPTDEPFERWEITNRTGCYRVRVTAGAYKVTARPRADLRTLIASVPQVVTVESGTNARADLHLRAKNAVITGQATFNGTGHPAFIRAYSDTGAHAYAQAGPQGNYRLAVSAGDTWHVQAVSEMISATADVTQTIFLKSARVAITPEPGLNGGNDLALQQSDTLPDALAFAFDAAEDQALTLSDGAQLIIPAGALAPQGPVVITARPLPELADNGGAQPVSFGYRVQAFDASRIPITHFNTPVTIRLPFTAAQLASLGITADQLVPSYWDEATASWKPVPHVAVEVDPNGDGFVTTAVDHFTDYALLAPLEARPVFLPIVLS